MTSLYGEVGDDASGRPQYSQAGGEAGGDDLPLRWPGDRLFGQGADQLKPEMRGDDRLW